jgi:hypothetical protein
MLKRPSGKSCAGAVCATCPSRPVCEYVETTARWECEVRQCPKRNMPGQCLCPEIMPTVRNLQDEYCGKKEGQ